MKIAQSQQLRYWNNVNDVVVSLLLTLNIFYTFFSDSLAATEPVNIY